MKILVLDRDKVGDNDYVDTLTGSVHLDPLGSNKQFTLTGKRTELTAILWYICRHNFYDCEECGETGTPRCSVFCDADCPHDQHGTCDKHGNFVCNQGTLGGRKGSFTLRESEGGSEIFFVI